MALLKANTGIGTTNPTSALHVIGDVLVTGVVTATTFNGDINTGVATITKATITDLSNTYLTSGISTITTINNTFLNTSGVGTIATLRSGSGIVTTLSGTNLSYTNGNIVTGVVTNISGTNLNYTGVGTITTFNSTNSTITFLDNTNINSTGVVTSTRFSTGATGTGINITSGSITGPSTIIIDPAGVGDNSGAVRIKGDFYVDGTEFIVNSTTIELADFNVGIATTVGTNFLLDGAGIGIGSTNIRKTFTYDYSSDALKSSENFDLATGKVYKIDEVEVLSATQLTVANINAGGISTIGIASISQLLVTGVSTFTGLVDANGGATIDNIRIGIADNNTIDTSTGGLTLNSNSGTVTVDDNLAVSGSNTLSFNSNSLNISHSGGNANIFNGSGDLILGSDGNASIRLERVGVATLARFTHNGSAELYYAGSKQLETLGSGVTITGTNFANQLSISGVSTFTGLIDANGGATIDNIQIGITGDNEIDTSTGNLTIDSAGGTVTVDDQLVVTGIATFNSNVDLDQSLNVDGNVIVTGLSTFVGVGTFSNDLYVGGDLYVKDDLVFDELTARNAVLTGNLSVAGVSTFTGLVDANGGATIDNIQIGVTGDNEIDTSTGNLTIDSAGGTVTVDDQLVVTGIATFNSNVDLDQALNVDGNVTVTGLSTFVGIVTNQSTIFATQLSVSGVSTFVGLVDANGGAEIDNIRIGVANDNTIDTSTGGLTLDSNSGTVTINDQLVVTGLTTFNSNVDLDQALNVDGNVTVTGLSTFVGVSTFSNDLYVGGDLYVKDDLILDEITSRNINVTGVGTITTLNSTFATLTNINSTGITTVGIVTANQIFVSGVTTSTGGFVGALTGIAASATQLVTPRSFEITGDIVASPIFFDGTGNVSLAATIQPNSVGLGTDTTGDYVQSLTGTSNQITVTGGTGEGSTPTLSFPNQVTIPQDLTVIRDVQIDRNLNVGGNITIGGTAATIFVQTIKVSDSDLVLGFRTDAFGNDISNDTTANHGGIAVASTEGSPLVNLNIAGIETLPPTYKKIMWFRAGEFAGLGTDAWLFNYGVGIGSTQFPSGTRLAAGSVQFTENDLAVVRDINASGIITAATGKITTLNSTNANILTGLVTSISGTNLNYTGVSTANVLGAATLNVSGVSTFVGVGTFNNDLYVGGDLYVADDLVIDELNSRNINVTGVGTVVNLNVTTANIATGHIVTGVVTSISGTNLNYTGVGTIATLNSTTGSITNLSGTSVAYTNANIVTGIVTNISGTNLNYTGVGTIATLNSTTSNITNANIVTGVVTSISGTNLNYTGVGTVTTLNSTTGSITNLSGTSVAYTNANVVTGVVTDISGTNLNYTGVGTIATLNSTTGNLTTANITNANIVTGIVTNISGTNLNYTGVGTIATLNSTTGSITTLSGTNLAYTNANVVTGIITDISGTNLNYVGVGTITTLNSTTSNLTTANITNANIVTGIVTTLSGTNLNYVGVGTIATLNSTTGSITTLSGTNLAYTNGNIVTGIITDISGTNLNYTGVGTITTLNSTTGNITTLNSTNANVVTGIVTNLSGTNLSYTGVGTIATLNSTTGTITNLSGTNLNYTGVATITTLNVTTVTNTNINATGVITAAQFSTGPNGIGINTDTISGPAVIYIDPAAVGDNTGAVRIKGDFYVDGTQTVINSQTIDLADFRIGIGTTATNDIVLDGAGIGIGSASNQKTFVWNNASSSLKSSENLDLASGKTYKINGTDVLSSTTLGSGVLNSSLTSVGTLLNLNVSGLSTFAGITTVTGETLFTKQLSVSGLSTFVGVGTFNSDLYVGGSLYIQNDLVFDEATVRNINVTGVSTLGVASARTLYVTGISTFADGPVFIGSGTSTGTSSQRLQTTGGAYISGNVGIGTSLPRSTYKLDIIGDVNFDGNLFQNNTKFVTGVGIGSTNINPGSGVISQRIGAGFTDINIVGTGLSITGYGSTVVIDFGNLGGALSISTSVTSVAQDLTFVGGATTSVIGIATITDRLVYVPSTGRVGVGTSAPAFKLDVVGDINSSTALKVGGVNILDEALRLSIAFG